MNKKIISAAVLFATAAPSTAFAHTGGHHLVSASAGLLHPLFGLDHLLALVAAGLWLSLQKGANRTVLGGAFVATLGLGIALGSVFTGVAFEAGITATLIVLGALLACCIKMPTSAGASVLALVAATHGFIHGTELPPAAAGTLSFSLGLTLASAAVVTVCAVVGRFTRSGSALLGARVAGVAIAVFGVSAVF